MKVARTLDELYEAMEAANQDDQSDDGEQSEAWDAAVTELRQGYGDHAVTVMTLFVNYEREAGSCQEQNWGDIKPVLEFFGAQHRKGQ